MTIGAGEFAWPVEETEDLATLAGVLDTVALAGFFFMAFVRATTLAALPLFGVFPRFFFTISDHKVFLTDLWRPGVRTPNFLTTLLGVLATLTDFGVLVFLVDLGV